MSIFKLNNAEIKLALWQKKIANQQNDLKLSQLANQIAKDAIFMRLNSKLNISSNSVDNKIIVDITKPMSEKEYYDFANKARAHLVEYPGVEILFYDHGVVK